MWENEILGGPDYWINRIQYLKQPPILEPYWLKEQKKVYTSSDVLFSIENIS